MNRPILCLDFDGVIHSYTSGWKGPAVILDPPVPGALEFIERASERFNVSIFSSRSNQAGGVEAMSRWLGRHAKESGQWNHPTECPDWIANINWARVKPPAMVTLDDRALTFTGTWPDIGEVFASCTRCSAIKPHCTIRQLRAEKAPPLCYCVASERGPAGLAGVQAALHREG